MCIKYIYKKKKKKKIYCCFGLRKPGCYRKCPRIDASGLPCITKVNHMVNDLGKLLPIMEYVDETLFERRYGRIAQIMRLPVQAAVIKALLNF